MGRTLSITLVALAVATSIAAIAHDVRGETAAAATPSEGAACPRGMVLVAGGTAALGVPNDADALSPATRTMSAFCIDRTEVTVAQYRACVAAGRCAAPETTIFFPGFGPPEPMRGELSRFCNVTQADHAQHPMNCVDLAAAEQYCAFEGGRLPQEEEWEYAARGPSGQRFPWGAAAPTAPAGDLCWDRRTSGLGTCAVGQFPSGASPSGALDMAGNVWEWTSSRWSDGVVVRGGGWTNYLKRYVSPAFRWPLVPATRLNCLGFRCVRPLDK